MTTQLNLMPTCMCAPTKPDPAPVSPSIYHNKTPDLLSFHPSAFQATHWPGALRRDEGSGRGVLTGW